MRVVRWIGRGVLAVLAMLLLAAVGLTLWLRTSLPQVDGERPLSSLQAPVTVARDSFGIPHIRAASWLDAHRALGFLHAQDRLFQMEMSRRLARGRLAEIAGGSAVDVDKRMRTFGLAELARKDADALPPDVRAVFDAYAEGVNDFLKTRSGALPPEFLAFPEALEPWTPADSLLWLKLMSLQLTADWSAELERAALAKRLSAEQIAELYPQWDGPVTLGMDLPPAAVRQAMQVARVVQKDAGSNLWAYDDRHTDTGKPILANDPHLGFTAPNVWYLVRIETPDGVRAGASAPGFPLVVLGHNGKTAWALTNAYGDTSDVFVERTDPSDPGKYLAPDGPKPFATRRETISIRFGQPVQLTVRSTRHGPVISDAPGRSGRPDPAEGTVLALSHTGLLPGDGTAAALWMAQQADSAAGLIAAMRGVQAPQQNIAVADMEGNIGLIAPALVPLRRLPAGLLPVPGWDGSHDWTGFIPFEELPQVINPASGRLVNANNRPVGPDYPYDLGHAWVAPFRAEAIIQALDRSPKQSVRSSEAVQSDVTSITARRLLANVDWPRIGDALPGDVADAMRAWDGRMDKNRPEPLLYYAWLRAMERGLYADEAGDAFAAVNDGDPARVLFTLTQAPHWCDDHGTNRMETCADIVRQAFASAYALVADRFGKDWRGWRWGEAHRAHFRHLLFGFIPVLRDLFDVSVPHGGGRDTPNAGYVSLNEATLFRQVHGASFRAIYDLADLNRSRFVQALGQSGNIFSPHYADLLPLWARGETVTLGPLDDIAAAHVLQLLPAAAP